jgi:hypothetical protein
MPTIDGTLTASGDGLAYTFELSLPFRATPAGRRAVP